MACWATATRKAGTFTNPKGSGYDLTLVEAEALEDCPPKASSYRPSKRAVTSS